ncbi:enoyl-CoA hydratase [Clostridium sp. AM29-11AC]|uniref:enoyl-CoA hydratase/isomerase family protein n=1 Tax=Clostridium sp. AM29-11AC TaxID=2293028 RepID=UPI000E522DCD|nr:enoyl-CoA hydratase-related protein [Clostridium sp. AM29-11AC]RHT55884.1 enoyl-CoA hydratase [Clostridium sp. AM29-11AC]
MADLIYEVKGHLARITMNRPEHLNCFSEEMIHLWTRALEDVRDREDIYAVLLSGNGKAFCAGGDVKAMAAGDGFFESHDDISSTALARKNSLWKGIQRIPLILEEIDKPVVAKIHGAAVGAGLDMALMCDVRIASESATMSESYFNAGIVPGDGGAYFLPRIIGRDKALDMFWTTKVLKGAEAERIGLVTHVVPDDELDDYVEAYMQKLLEAPQTAMRLTKRAIYQSEQITLRSSLDMVSSFMGIVTELDDYRTRTSALVEKLNRKRKKHAEEKEKN